MAKHGDQIERVEEGGRGPHGGLPFSVSLKDIRRLFLKLMEIGKLGVEENDEFNFLILNMRYQ